MSNNPTFNMADRIMHAITGGIPFIAGCEITIGEKNFGFGLKAIAHVLDGSPAEVTRILPDVWEALCVAASNVTPAGFEMPAECPCNVEDWNVPALYQRGEEEWRLFVDSPFAPGMVRVAFCIPTNPGMVPDEAEDTGTTISCDLKKGDDESWEELLKRAWTSVREKHWKGVWEDTGFDMPEEMPAFQHIEPEAILRASCGDRLVYGKAVPNG